MGKNVKELLDKVLTPLRDDVRSIIKNNIEKELKENGFFQASVYPYNEKISLDEIKNRFEKIKDKEEWQEVFRLFLNNLDDFVDNEENRKKLDNLKEIFGVNEDEEFIDDGFLDFSEENEELDDFHYEEYQKINAKEYMQSDDLDKSLLEEIASAIDRYIYVKDGFEVVDKDYIEEVKEVVSPFIDLFELSFEFKKVAVIFYKLKEFLNEIDLEKLTEENKKFLKIYFDAIVNDLIKWYDEVVKKQSAQDIHYMDASFYANIMQIENILKE